MVRISISEISMKARCRLMSLPSISPSDAEYITGILDEFSRLMLAAATRCGPPGETEDILLGSGNGQ